MKRIIAYIMAIAIMLIFAACKTPVAPVDASPAPTEQQAEAPTNAPTTEPTEEPTPAPTEVPAYEVGGVDYRTVLENGAAAYFDLDGDGLPDSVLFTDREPIANEHEYKVTIIRGADPEASYEYVVGSTFGCAWVIDSDPNDGRLEVLVTDDGESGDPKSTAIRWNETKNEFERFVTGGVSLEDEDPESFVFSSEDGFSAIFETRLLGANYVMARVRLTAEGFELCSEAYTYIEGGFNTLVKEMPVKRINDDGSEGESMLLPVGSKLVPVSADAYRLLPGETAHVTVRLEDGSLCIVEVIAGEGGVLGIDGVSQWEYADFSDEG